MILLFYIFVLATEMIKHRMAKEGKKGLLLFNELIFIAKKIKERITANLAQAAYYLASAYLSKTNAQGYPQE